MKLEKKFSFISLLTLIFGLTLFMNSGIVKAEDIINPDSITIDGEIVKGDLEVEETEKTENINQPRSSTIVYVKDGYVPNTLSFKNLGWVNKHKHFFNTSVTIPSGTNYKYTWERTITKSASSSHNISNSLRLQGGAKFISEIDYKFEYGYSKSSTVTMTQGTKSETNITKPGTYQIDFYIKGIYYDIKSDWKAYTVDKPKVQTTVTRNLGYLIEPTNYLHLEVTKQ
ncbi:MULTISPECIES: hypothetical protein [unclassified Lysinibacillus]|uniref:hypothetical protein n=1 Tax=unclassified Lysinibacillus TaxID=2636778 RepID=UPI0035E16C61